MRELRTCPVTGRVVLLNDAWVDRPPPPPPHAEPADACWFCAASGPAIAWLGAVRALPHPVPALGIEGDVRPATVAGAVRRDAVGAHELVFGGHEESEADLVRLVAARIADLRRDARLRGFSATRRHAPGRHAVWQVMALPWEVPHTSPAAWRDHELHAGHRLVERAGGTATFLAWAPRAPFETWVVPEHGHGSLHAGDPGPVAAAAGRHLARLARALRGPPIDLVLVDGEPWRIEIVPRLAGPTAVEVAAGIPAHGTFPEAAAEHLRGMREAG